MENLYERITFYNLQNSVPWSVKLKKKKRKRKEFMLEIMNSPVLAKLNAESAILDTSYSHLLAGLTQTIRCFEVVNTYRLVIHKYITNTTIQFSSGDSWR